MAMLGRKEAWPAVAILFIGTLSLGITLKAAQQDMPLDPVWIMGALAGLYVVLAAIAGGLTWRFPVVLVAMLASHAVTALLMGFGYAAVEGRALDAYQALIHGLWNYIPGTALQFGFACILGITLQGQLEPVEEQDECEEEPEEALSLQVVDLTAAQDAQSAVNALTVVPQVAGALLAEAGVYAGGIWERDPAAALARVQALLSRTGAGLNSFPLSQANLLTRTQHGVVAALLVTDEMEQQAAHALLRELWNVGERLWPRDADGGSETEPRVLAE
jgi:hypothetical protein